MYIYSHRLQVGICSSCLQTREQTITCIYIYIYIHTHLVDIHTHTYMCVILYVITLISSILHVIISYYNYSTGRKCIEVCIHIMRVSVYTRLVSNSAPTWSSRCCFIACHFEFGKIIRKECD